jgi:uncharacterized membrane protein
MNRAAKWRPASSSNEGLKSMYPTFDALGLSTHPGVWIAIAVAAAPAFILWRSLWTIGPTEVGLVRKRFSLKKL